MDAAELGVVSPPRQRRAAQTPIQAATWPVDLALTSTTADALATSYGELIQFGKVVPWRTGIPVPHRATADRTAAGIR